MQAYHTLFISLIQEILINTEGSYMPDLWATLRLTMQQRYAILFIAD